MCINDGLTVVDNAVRYFISVLGGGSAKFPVFAQDVVSFARRWHPLKSSLTAVNFGFANGVFQYHGCFSEVA
ncbi:hypothetical Protein YC6258_05854 [Gynuella sunshinyii YC6258]|uniref:Uncharacterized protein n=1 Tax=Gynuella sunshinyii YC6258 TaxID=1445510 RepID=A0A0C5VT81_9GAMM|nr:hypothetical Protein YC6258_05854 [Gynuella sunshinyii YC6258]